MKILFATSEAVPFISTGGLGDVSGALPLALKKRVIGTRIIMPLYSAISKELRESMKFITSITVPLGWRNQYCGIFEAKANGIVYFFIDNEFYFKRNSCYGDYDDGERFAFFSRAVLEALPYLDFKPDVIHCNDWQTAMIPVYLKLLYSENPDYADIKTLFTIHNIRFQGKMQYEALVNLLGLSNFNTPLLWYNDSLNLMKGAIESSDAITTVSPTYANEIRNSFYSYGLDYALNANSSKLYGILNGIDTESYDPSVDKNLIKNFDVSDIGGKAENKTALQQHFKLEENPTLPIIAMVTRLTDQKGIDLVINIIYTLMKEEKIQFILLGSGEWHYEEFFRKLQNDFPDSVGVSTEFNSALARKIYAGADLFLMPSMTEPCGLSQMIAMRYGTVPIVRETGGLCDTIICYNPENEEGDGFSFKNFNAHDMLYTIKYAVDIYMNKKDIWNSIIKRCMDKDFSWNHPAREYIKLYKLITNENKDNDMNDKVALTKLTEML